MVLFFAQLFVEEAVSFLSESHAAKTARAADTVVTEGAVRAVFGVLTVVAVIAFFHINTLVAELTAIAVT